MSNTNHFWIYATLIVLRTCLVHSSCVQIKEDRTILSDSYTTTGNDVFSKCWEILNPSKDLIYFRLDELNCGTAGNSSCNLTVEAPVGGMTNTYWSGRNSGYHYTRSPTAEIKFNVDSRGLPNNFTTNFTLLIQRSIVYSSCSQINDEKWKILDTYTAFSNFKYSKCWEILNPNKHQLYLYLEELNMRDVNYTRSNLTVTTKDDGKITTYWSGLKSGGINTKSSKVEIRFSVESLYFPNDYLTNFTLKIQKSINYSRCSQINEETGIISDSYLAYGHNTYSKCWELLNPTKHQIMLQLDKLNLQTANQVHCNLTVALKDEGTIRTYYSGMKSGTMETVSSKVEIRFNVLSSPLPNNYISNFTLHFQKKILPDVDVRDIRSRAIDLLKNKSSHLDMRYDSIKALTALYLAGHFKFDGTDDKEELSVKETELEIALSLQRNPATNMDLSTYINFLLVTCNSPRQFGFPDLIQQLRHLVETSGNFTHPMVYLALCNANEPWPKRAVRDLQNILSNRDQYIFVEDIQVLAVMAISCKLNQSNSLNANELNTLMPIYNASIRHIMQKQLSDGSFGSLRETAIVVQTLIASGKELSFDWNSRRAILFIAKELNSTSVHFQDLYLSLPVLNKKSLADIANKNCKGNPRNKDSLIREDRGQKVEVPSNQVRYSLYVGDDKELIRTTSLPFPDNFTAYQVMLLAEAKHSNFNFQWKKVSGKMYVQTIAGISNDPINGKFWMLYRDSNNNKPPTLYVTKGPDEIVLKKGDHLIMWYKTANM